MTTEAIEIGQAPTQIGVGDAIPDGLLLPAGVPGATPGTGTAADISLAAITDKARAGLIKPLELNSAALTRNPGWEVDSEGYYSLTLKVGNDSDYMFPIWWKYPIDGADIEIFRSAYWNGGASERPIQEGTAAQAYLYLLLKGHDVSWGAHYPRSRILEYAKQYHMTIGRLNTDGMVAKPEKIDPAGSEMPYGWLDDGSWHQSKTLAGLYLRGNLDYRFRTKSAYIADSLKIWNGSDGEQIFAYQNAKFLANKQPWSEAITELSGSNPFFGAAIHTDLFGGF